MVLNESTQPITGSLPGVAGQYDERYLRAELQRLFGYGGFKGRQGEVIAQVVAGVDTLAVMPTGAGKSLCYQLPAMLLPGTTVVISPLIALMKDQYDSLPAEVYERTTFINSSLDMDALSQRMDEILAGRYKLVYCAPERLRQQPFVEALRRAQISVLVVDEAHCVSMWGHDFRPDYLFIGKCIPSLGHPTVLALTATATPAIRAEIASQLGRELSPVVASVYRPNLYYEVEPLSDKEEKMRRLLEICRTEKGPGVVYARSREACEQLAGMLRRSGVSAAHYHAGLDSDTRARTQDEFMLDRVRVIVATIAFGMGIDKSNVRFIVHFSPPDSLESYIQESGRAERDGRPSRCVLFIASGDKANLTRWKRQEQLGVDELRAIYRELTKQVTAGGTDYVNMEVLCAQASEAAGKVIDETQVRVGMSLLERAGLIVRHPDAPRNVVLQLTPQGAKSGEADLSAFLQAAALGTYGFARRDVRTLATSLEMGPTELERKLLAWEEAGLLTFRGERREPVVERLNPPPNVADLIYGLLQQADRAQQHQIAQILDYAAAERCRHQMLAAHLGERIERCETNCDFCAPPADRPDAVKVDAPELPDNPGQIIVECLASFPFVPGRPSLVRALLGSAASNVKADRVRHFGALAAASASAVERAIDELVAGGYLAFFESEDGFRLLRITEEGREGVHSGAVTLARKRSPKPAAGSRQQAVGSKQSAADALKAGNVRPTANRQLPADGPPTPEEADLFERLRAWRKVVAGRLGMPPYIIFHDKTLWAIARARPETPDELLAVKGVGQGQFDKYGSELLELLSQAQE